MGDWHQPMPAPYSPGASLPAGMMGTGMMHAANWAEISHKHGQSFSSRWLDVIISSYTTPKSRYPGKNSARVPARRPATGRTMLAERQSELAQLQQWHQDGQMGMMG
jgi:hypothetical protein